MSNLNPGGSRSTALGRIFGFESIKRALRSQRRNRRHEDSIARGNRHGGPHEHKREIARRLRQQEATHRSGD